MLSRVQNVDPLNPLDYGGRAAHLLDGVQGFWLPLPHTTGGTRLYDLSGYGRHGGFVGDTSFEFSPSRSTPGIKLDGSGDYVDIGKIGLDSTQDKYSLVIQWHNYTSGSKSDALFEIGGNVLFKIDQFFNKNKFGLTFSSVADYEFSIPSTPKGLAIYSIDENNEASIWMNGKTDSVSIANKSKNGNAKIGGAGTENIAAIIDMVAVYPNRAIPVEWGRSWRQEARRGFPGLLNTRPRIYGLAGTGGAITAILSLTDKPETVSASGQVDVEASASITEGKETVSAGGSVDVDGSFSVTDSGELVSVIGETRVSGTLALTDQGEVVQATGLVSIEGSLAITDQGERVQIREVTPPRLATINARLTDAITLNATLEDIITLNARLHD